MARLRGGLASQLGALRFRPYANDSLEALVSEPAQCRADGGGSDARGTEISQTRRWRGLVWTRGQWPLALMDCPPPEAPIWISRLMRIPSQRVCFGSRSD